MQYVNCKIAIGGDALLVVEKKHISIPELALMRHLHGEDGVKDIEPLGQTKEPRAQAKARLIEKYQHIPSAVQAIEKLWPGLNPTMPHSLEDIGLEADAAMETVRTKTPTRVRARDLAAQEDDPEAETDDGSSYANETEGGEDEEPAPRTLAASKAAGAELARRVAAGAR